MSKHTPGPWKAHPQTHNIFSASEYQWIAQADPKNVPIIESAPEMLSALRTALLALRASYNSRDQHPVEQRANDIVIQVVEEAILKAEGHL